MKTLKAIAILEYFGAEQMINNNTPFEEEDYVNAIDELEELQNRSCENCKKGFDCPIFRKLWKEKLRKEGYLMSRKEFDCRFWESK